MKKLFYVLIALFLMIISYSQVTLASGVAGYQPKLPKKIKERIIN